MQIEYPEVGSRRALDISIAIHFSTDWKELESWCRLMQINLVPGLAYLINHTCTTYRNSVSEFDRKEVPRPYYQPGAKRDVRSLRSALRGR